MKGIHILFAIVSFVLLIVNGLTVFAQSPQEFLEKLKVGEWVEIEGVPQTDASILVKEIKILYGEMEDDDYEVNGIVTRIIPEEKKIFILNLPIIFNKDTEYDDKYEAIKSFSDIKTGLYVEVEGSLLKDSTFQAKEIGLKKMKESKKGIFEWQGRVQAVSLGSNSFTMLGHTVILTPDTKIKSLIH